MSVNYGNCLGFFGLVQQIDRFKNLKVLIDSIKIDILEQNPPEFCTKQGDSGKSMQKFNDFFAIV